MDVDEQRWNEFVSRFAESQRSGMPPEGEIRAEAEALYREGNRLAVKAAADANRSGGSGTMGNPVHDLARVYFMRGAESPGQNVPVSMDESGLWQPGKQKI